MLTCFMEWRGHKRRRGRETKAFFLWLSKGAWQYHSTSNKIALTLSQIKVFWILVCFLKPWPQSRFCWSGVLVSPAVTEAQALQVKQAKERQVDDTETQDDHSVFSSLLHCPWLVSKSMDCWICLCVVLGIKPRTAELYLQSWEVYALNMKPWPEVLDPSYCHRSQ